MILCVTGPMAAGKNAVCRILEERGFIALDADRQVHGAIEKAAPEIIKTFSNEAKAQNITLSDFTTLPSTCTTPRRTACLASFRVIPA